jgi:hypothetical protein
MSGATEVAVTVVLALRLRREEAAEDYEPCFKQIKACRESELLFRISKRVYGLIPRVHVTRYLPTSHSRIPSFSLSSHAHAVTEG